MADDIQIQKMDGKSLDVTGVNKEKLKTVFPECFTEGNLDIDKLLSLCGEYIDNDFEKYKFEWKGKSECYRIAGKRSTGTLRPCPEESVNFENTNNLYIEGDNLEVLKLLQTAYYRKVKMIYIDPPYNTGNDFVYEDDFKDPMAKYKEITSQTTKSNPETMGRFHTNWLNMMYPRLRLAANLLRDDGVIFISIDDNEVTNLRKLCDEVFGEENFIGQFVVNSTPNARDYGHIGKMHEYTLFYAKNFSETKSFLIPEKEKIFKYSDNLGGFNIHPLYNSNVSFHAINRPNLYYPFYLLPNKSINNVFYELSLFPQEGSIEIYPPKSQKEGIQFVWRWGKEKSLLNLNKEIIGYRTEDGEFRIVQKMRHSEKLIRSLLLEKDFTSRRGTAEVEELFSGKNFDFPKPKNLIKLFLQASSRDDDLILDFFSGSATTAHAVMQLNAEDGGHRQFIMVQLPELTDEKSEAFKAGYKNICEIGKERIRRAGAKIKEQNAEVDVGFKVFKLDTSNLVKWDDTPVSETEVLKERFDSVVKTLKFDRSELDVVYEVMLKLGIPVTYKVNLTDINGRKVYSIGDDGLILVCLDGSNGGITPEDISAMCDLTPAKIVAAEEAFKDDVALSNAYYISKDKGVEIELL